MEKIKQRRLELGLSVDELARLIGKDRSTIYRYEGGDFGKMPIDLLCPLAQALQVTPNALVGWDDFDSVLHIDAETREAYKASFFTHDPRMAKNHLRWIDMSGGHEWTQEELDVLYECGKSMIVAKKKGDYEERLQLLSLLFNQLDK